MNSTEKQSEPHQDFLKEHEAEQAFVPPVEEPHEADEPHPAHAGREPNQRIEQLKKEMEALQDAEAKLKHCIQFMETTLSQKGSPDFRSFWDARSICLELFKGNIPPASRIHMWAIYSDLSKEARRLKQILDEQSAFAAEQIDIAITALEKEIEDAQVKLEIPKDVYERLQGELNVLNAHASRINALRKELLKTEMRIRQKNKFFQRLSSAGDKVFPRRKELIKEVSERFLADVDAFVTEHFSKELEHESLFNLREDIKNLQALAKILTLNTQTFNYTRLKLSECWDKIKVVERERKKSRAQQIQAYRHNAQAISDKIKKAIQTFQEGNLNNHQVQQEMDNISHEIRQTDLGRDEVKSLRDELGQLRTLILEKQKVEEGERSRAEQEKEKQKRDKIEALRQKLQSLIDQVAHQETDALNEQKEQLVKEINGFTLSKNDRQDFDKLFKRLKDVIAERRVQALMSLPADKRQALEQLREGLKQLKDQRQQIKGQLEQFRRTSSGSGLDFEQAMSYQSQIAAEKESLERTNQSIREIENKISQLEKT